MTQHRSRTHVAVLIDFAGDTGGAETLAAQLIERLDPARFRRTLVVYRELAGDGELRAASARVRDRLRVAGVDVLELGSRSRYDVGAWAPFVRLLRDGSVDVLHSHKFGPNLWATSFARLVGVPVVVAHEHTWSYEGARLRRWLDRWLIATGADAFVAVSELDRQRMERIERIPAWRIRYLPNGIPPPEATPSAELSRAVRRELDVPEAAPVIGAVGVFRAQKDFGTLVRAHRLLLERCPEVHLVLVGDGPERDRVEALIAREGTADRVRLTGIRSDAIRLAAAFDIAVNSSLFEGSALAVLEYMALGRPIVATAVGGTPHLLADGEAGVLVPPSDPAALAAGIGDLLGDEGRARALGERARARQRREFDIDVQVRRLEQLYLELIEGAGGRRRRLRRRPLR